MAQISKMKRERIKARLQAGEKPAVVARAEGVGYQTVWRIKNKVSRAKPGPRKTYQILTPPDRDEIIEKRGQGWNLARIARRFNVAESTVSRVCSGKTATHPGAL
jgi:DNA invertase Pin-like site-specific DNA recombinase